MDLKYINIIAYEVVVILLTEQIHIFWAQSSTNAHYKMVMFKVLEKLNVNVKNSKYPLYNVRTQLLKLLYNWNM